MQQMHRPSPAISFVGRHNSGKTTLVVKVIRELASRGVNVGSIKHHGHNDFDIDYPGKDSYRHREAGSVDAVVVSPIRMARITELEVEPECDQIVASMPDHDIIIVEGFRQSGLDVIEIMRAASERDQKAAVEFCETGSISGRVPRAVVSDIPEAMEKAASMGLPVFGFDDEKAIATYLQEHYVRPRLAVVIQAGGESRRMGRSKATVPFLGEPMMKRILRRVAPIADEIVITTNEPENLQFVYDDDYGCEIHLVTDVFNQRGALRGVYTALSSTDAPFVAMVACDMVYASASLIAAEASAVRKSHVDVVVPRTKFGFEPFHAVYRRVPCLHATRTLLNEGKIRATDLFDVVRVREFSSDEVREAAPGGGCFINVNTPDELKHVEESILNEGDR